MGDALLKRILSEHAVQSLMFINNSFQTTALTWIKSLYKKASTSLRRKRRRNIALRAGLKGLFCHTGRYQMKNNTKP